MRDPEEFLELQIKHADRSAKALANVDDPRLICLNTLGLVQKTLMAWLVSNRFSLPFDMSKLSNAISTLEKHSGVLLKSENTNFTIYLLACMITNSHPKGEILSACKVMTADISFLINASVVPYVYYDLVSSEDISMKLELETDKKRQLAVDSAVKYLQLFSMSGLPSERDNVEIERLFKLRKSNAFYSESRIYGGGPDNDYVCDLEFSAIVATKEGQAYAVPSS
ncbi:MAG: hypothetical protein GY777_00685 [Candidatus Brocadiaceae bacterium]|nr:hypothetical protein [Candidatus Brocadiaceae bacterium]